MTELSGPRLARIGHAVEVFVVWARLLDSHHAFPFGDLQLTRSQVEVLFLIAHSDGPATPGALATALGVTPGAVTQLVAGLAALGLVQQERDPGDGRRRFLRLSPRSRARVDEFEQGVVRRLAPRFDALDDAELNTLAELMGKMDGRQ